METMLQHSFVSDPDFLFFLMGLFRETEETMEDQDPRFQPSDTYIIPTDPSRGGKFPEVSHKTNAHVFVAFGLQVRKYW